METSDTPHELNGQAVKPKRKPRPKKDANGKGKVSKTEFAEAKAEEKRERVASKLSERKVEFLMVPWIPKGMLTLVVGPPAVGKSTFIAWLISQVNGAVMLPGYEETVEITTLPRLKANGANLHRVWIMDQAEYRLPRDKKRIASVVKSHEAQLLVIDPIDSYMEDELNENNGRDVRTFLESAAWIGEQTGCAVVGVRHPGKDRSNVMPGSRQWRAVPRSIVELNSDGATPPRFYMRHYKDSLGQDARARKYRTEGPKGQPKLFVLDDEVDASVARLAQSGEDPTERRDVQIAGMYARHEFETKAEPLVEDLMAVCRNGGVSDRARRLAMEILQIDRKPSSAGGKWIMYRYTKDWPKWTERRQE